MPRLSDRPILRQFIQLAALIAITFAAYFPVLRNGFIWDDNRYIEENFHLRTLHGLQQIWFEPLKAEPQYYPVTHTTFWLEFHLWRLNPIGYHLDNLLLHIASAAVLWRILRKLNVPGAWWAAAIFAVHPLQVESVAWATERKNILSGLFYFLSLTAYFRTRWGRRIWESGESAHIGAGWYALSLILFLAALLSKSVTSTMPAVILLLLWWKRGKIQPSDFYPLIPMFVAGISMGFLTGWMEKHVVGALGPAFDFLTPLDRICIAGRAFWFYLAKLLWPARLIFIYPHWTVDPGARPWWILFPASALCVMIACSLLRRKIGREPLVALLFFAGTLVPALGFVNVFPMQYSYVADHFQYIACIGPIALLVGIAIRFCNSRGIITALCALIACFCIMSNLRSRVYADRLTLWANTVKNNPSSPMAHNNYAVQLMYAGKLDDAKAQFHEAMRLEPDSADWIGLGQCYAIAGDFVNARDMYQKAVDAVGPSPEPVIQHYRARSEFQLGTAYKGLAEEFPAMAGQYYLKAEEAYRRAIDLYPEYEDPRLNLAGLLLQQARYSEAVDQCKAVLDENPESVIAHINLGGAYYMQNQLGPALEEYQAALNLDPQNADALASAGAILAQTGQIDRGISMLEEALKIDPNDQTARQNLRAAIAKKSQ
jgi:protein O-mannosyl-transferase